MWTLPGKKSHWYRTFGAVDADLLEHESDEIFMGAGLAPANGVRLTSRTRVKEQNVAGIAGLWADVDVAHPVHAKAANLPPDRKRAIDVLDRLPIKATILVDTGHGLHVWWLFPEPWIFSCAEQRDLARKAIKWWQATMKGLFSEQGWTIDSTHDLSRLMRVPGTWNNKDPNGRRPVEVVRNTRERYPKERFLDLLPDDFEATPLGSRKGKSRRNDGAPPPNPGLVLDPDAEPPFLKVEVLLDHDPRFRSTWRHTRSDLSDQSPSGYDLSLAHTAVWAGWTDQEVVNLVMAFRCKNGLPQKLRTDYFETTLRKARNFFQHEHVVQSALDMADSLDNAGEKGESANASRQEGGADDRSQMLRTLSKLFQKITILQIDRFSGATTTYVMVTDRGRVHLRGIQDVLNQNRFIERVAEETGEVLDISLKKPQWNRVAQLMLHAGVDHDMGEVGSVPRQLLLPDSRRLVLPVHLLCLAPLLSCISPVAGDVKLEDDGVVHHPVNGRGSGHGVGKDTLPLGEDQVGGDAQRPAFIAFGNEREEDLGLFGPLGQVAQVIQEQEVEVVRLA